MAMDPGAKRKKLYANGIVILGTRDDTYQLKLYPLVTHSICIRRHVESICEKDRISLRITLHDCPGRPSIFRIVEDFCYDMMDENDISVSNVVSLMATSNFLEMDGLGCRVLKFLEDNVFVSWESCLSFLAKFESTHGSQIVQDAYGIENSVFHKCLNAFLRYVKLPLMYSRSSSGTMCCNVTCLRRVAELLSPTVAEHIYKSCRSEQVGLCFNYETHDQADCLRSWFQIPLCMHFRGGPTSTDEMFSVKFYSLAAGKIHEVQWLEDLLGHLPSWSSRATLVLHLAKSMLLGEDVKIPSGTICLSRFRWSFLCVLLAATTRLRIDPGRRASAIQAQDLDEVIGDLQRMVSRGLCDVSIWNPETDCNLGDRNTDWSVYKNSHFIIKCVIPFSFDTLQLVLRHSRGLGFQLTISSLAEVLDVLLKVRIQQKWYTVRQALLIYQELPNEDRLSHAGIYDVFEDSLKRRALSAQDVHDLTQLLDYQKLSDDIVENFFAEVQSECDARLLQRFLTIQENRIRKEKSQNKVIQMRENHKLRIADFIKVRSEMRVQSVDLIKVTEDKLVAESHLEAEKEKSLLAEQKLEEVARGLEAEKTKTIRRKRKLEEVVRGLQAEKEKTTCQICFQRPRDVLSLPCMHFMYCFDCLHLAHQTRKICPTCRCYTSGVLKCNLSA